MPVPVYRAPMRARDRDDVAAGEGAEHALRTGVVALSSARGIERFASLPDGTFVWTRDTGGAYHLGRVSGPYRHEDSAAARAVGLHHVRPARWLDRPFGEPEVPAGVAHAFARGGRNFQRTHDAAAERSTARLWDAMG